MRNHNILRYLLFVLLVLLGVGGLAGGILMLVDPSGVSMGLSPDLLGQLPINTFVFPGLFLIFFMGFIPLFVGYGVWMKKSWAWAATTGQGILLVLWILFQVVLWGSPIIIQYVYLAWGFILLVLCQLPAVKDELR